MRALCGVIVVSASLLAIGGCRAREEGKPQPAFRPTATVKDIMLSIVDPEADVLWNAVATIVSLSGTEEREPRTDEEWTAVQRSAVQLVEATNLLRVPGRLVAKPGEKSENPRIELHPETIQKLIADDPATWGSLVDGLQDAAVPALNAANARNAKGLFDAGEKIEQARAKRATGITGTRPRAPRRGRWMRRFPPRVLRKHLRPLPRAASSHGPRSGKGPCARQRGHQDGNGPGVRDAQCRQASVQEVVTATSDGSLANVFVSLQGDFPVFTHSLCTGNDRSACVRVRPQGRRGARRAEDSNQKQRRGAP